MHPISRAAASIDIIDNYLTGQPIELVLKNWFRNNRFAGSNDRYLIRNIIFDIIRRRRSLFFPFQANGYEENGRLLVLSYLADHYDHNELMNEIKMNRYFSGVPNSYESNILFNKNKILSEATSPIKFDYPSFLAEGFLKSLEENVELVMKRMQERAPLYLRVNTLKILMSKARNMLADEGIVCSRLNIAAHALQVVKGRRKIKKTDSYNCGFVEIQDVSSQIMSNIPEFIRGSRILDYCAGGGGKTLAMAARTMNDGELLAYDINEKRLTDLRYRALRAGAKVRLLTKINLKNYLRSCDVVFVDAPCSGSGTWRRDPEAKWNLTETGLEKLKNSQADLLEEASYYVKLGGVITYVVCSLLPEEGDMQVNDFLSKNPNFKKLKQVFLHPLVAGDGFFGAVLKRLK